MANLYIIILRNDVDLTGFLLGYVIGDRGGRGGKRETADRNRGIQRDVFLPFV